MSKPSKVELFASSISSKVAPVAPRAIVNRLDGLSAIDDIDTTNPSTSSVTGRISAATSTPPVALAGSDQIRDGYLVYVPGRKYKVGERVLLPIEKTAENPKNPRVFYPEKEMQSLRDSLQREGQMQAAIAYVDVDADGKHMLKGGHRTRRCLMRLKVPYIKVEFVARSDDAVREFIQARDLNAEHGKQTYLDEALVLAEFLKEDEKLSTRELAAQVDMDETVLCRWLQIIELPRNILEIMSEHIERFGMSAAYAIYRFWDKDRNNETATLDLVHRTVSEQLTVRALDQIASKGSDADSKTPVTRRKVVTRAAFKGSNGQTCDMKALADGILLDARNLDATTRNELFEEIEKVLRTRNFVDAEA